MKKCKWKVYGGACNEPATETLLVRTRDALVEMHFCARHVHDAAKVIQPGKPAQRLTEGGNG
jgi:hypothetical protein